MLKQFGPEIWIAGGSDLVVVGFHYPTRMAVIRLADGGLFIWSPVALTDALGAQVDALGPVRVIVAPNSLHHMFVAQWHAAYPKAKLFAAPGLRKKRKDIEFDSDLSDSPRPEWAREIDQVVVRGNLITTEVAFFHRQSGAVLFTDLIQQFPPGWYSGWRAWVAKLDLMVSDEPAVPRKFRVAFANRRAARKALKHILDWPAERVLMAHGPTVDTDAKAVIARAFRWLTG